ncbi:hypothetical protein [Pseudomonas sp. PD9R]|uniref:hypothetical protein n=1 Tax=Pseudomonas sp. PD9R TaxID=2853534 RepID=UPI001C45D935|nr:hypothetical protein [Pseudomonas sp. PD9R]MBV6823775.1 hypothetical protein [Pseudomonas sp. PD9R]
MNDEYTSGDNSESLPFSALPQPHIMEAPRSLLCLSKLDSRGATLTVAPWAEIAPGQRFWLNLTGASENGVSILSIYSAEPLTPDEAINGLSRNITQQQLEHFAHSSVISIGFKVSLNGSQREEEATKFPPNSISLIKKFFDQTNFTGSLNDWSFGTDVTAQELTFQHNESNDVLRYDRTEANSKIEKTILYKDFSALLPRLAYTIYICNKRVLGAGALGVSTGDGPIKYMAANTGFWWASAYIASIASTNTQIRISIPKEEHNLFTFDMDDITLIMEELPIPTISHIQTNLLFLNTIGSEGIKFSVESWGASPGQKVWLTANHDHLDYPLLSGHSLTAEEARDGLSATLDPDVLKSLANHSPLSFTLDITRDGSVAVNDATKFKILAPKLITDFVSRTTFSANNWDKWVANPFGPGNSTSIINEDNHYFARTTVSTAHGDSTILYKHFAGLSIGALYKLVVPMRRVDLKSHAPNFSIQLSTGESKETFTLTSMEWTDFSYSLYVPQTNIRFQIINLANPFEGNIYDIDDICLIKV